MPQRLRAGLQRVGTKFAQILDTIFSVDVRSLAVFRIGLALILLVDLVSRASDIRAFYTDWGVLPRIEVLGGDPYAWNASPSWYPSVHLLTNSVLGQALWFAVAGLAAVALLAGYRTRLAACASWFLLLSLHTRNPLILSGGDWWLCLLLFWGMFLPLGAWYSLDHRRDPSAARMPGRVCSVGTQAVMFQACFVYLMTSVMKYGPEWRDGTAVYYALNIDYFVLPFGKLVLSAPRLCTVATHVVFALERIATWWLLCPVAIGLSRTIAVTVFMGLQLCFGLSFNLGLFPWVGAVAMLPFVPTWWWERMLKRVRHASALSGAPTRSSWWANTLAATALIYVGVWNVGAVARPFEYAGPGRLAWVGSSLHLGQVWNMFAPSPEREDGWLVVPGRLADGKVVDLLRDGGPVSWEKPPCISATFKNLRWQLYLERLWKLPTSTHRLYFSAYLCREWNARHPGADQLREVTIYLVGERTLPDYRAAPLERLLLVRQPCFMNGRPLLGDPE